jgi:YVTN family beta-propeller protein
MSRLVHRIRRRIAICLCLAASSVFSSPALTNSDPVVFVLNSLEASVSVIDAGTWKEVARVPVGKEPHHIYLTPDGKSVLVANAASNSISVLDPLTGKLERTINQIVDPYHLRFSPDMQWFVTAANRLDHIDIYRWHGLDAKQPFELVKRIPAAKTPSHIVIDSKS